MKLYFAFLTFIIIVIIFGVKNRLDREQEAEATTTEKSASDSTLADTNSLLTDTNNIQYQDIAGVEIPKYETSRGGQTIYHIGYTVSYDADFKTPQWVAWQLTSEKANGSAPRYNKFKADPEVIGAKAYPKDYTNSGYDRGHMAPAGDMKWSEQAMKESFYMTNICPQNRNLNRGDWKDLEEQERYWATRYGSVSIAAGPIYYTRSPLRIGANNVAVPDAFFKVLLVDYPKSPKAYGFIFKNTAGSHPLSYYQLTVDEVEKVTGMDFFSALPDPIENKIEAELPSL